MVYNLIYLIFIMHFIIY